MISMFVQSSAKEIISFGFKNVIRRSRINPHPEDDINMIVGKVKYPAEIDRVAFDAWTSWSNYPKEIDDVIQSAWNNSSLNSAIDYAERAAETAWRNWDNPLANF